MDFDKVHAKKSEKYYKDIRKNYWILDDQVTHDVFKGGVTAFIGIEALFKCFPFKSANSSDPERQKLKNLILNLVLVFPHLR